MIHPCIVVENVEIKRNIFELIGREIVFRGKRLKKNSAYINNND